MFAIVKRKIKLGIFVAITCSILLVWIRHTNFDRHHAIIKSIVPFMVNYKMPDIPRVTDQKANLVKITDKKANITMVTDKMANIPRVTNKANITMITDKLLYPPFQPDVKYDFPTVNGSVPRIPHILHQTYRDEMIPSKLSSYVRKLVNMHPDWQYYFWSDESARKLIAERHPQLLHTYDHFNESIKKGDALRYVVLYEFGGAYIDMDVDTLRPLDRAMMKYACIFPTEPFEHSILLYNTEIFVNNAIMFCRPKHPFLKMLMDNLQTTDPTKQVVTSTGPIFVTKNLIAYNNIDVNATSIPGNDPSSNSPYFNKFKLPEAHDDAVYVPNTHYFTDEIDISIQRSTFTGKCRNTAEKTLLVQNACKEMERRGMDRKDKSFRFLTHKWYHLWFMSTSIQNLWEKEDIHKIVPKCTVYGND